LNIVPDDDGDDLAAKLIGKHACSLDRLECRFLKPVVSLLCEYKNLHGACEYWLIVELVNSP